MAKSAAAAHLEGMIPALLAATAQLKRNPQAFVVGKATDGLRQVFEIYCSRGDIDCCGEPVIEPPGSRLTIPFHDFGYVRWPIAAVRAGLSDVTPILSSGGLQPEVVFVHPFASLIQALESEPLEDDEMVSASGNDHSAFALRFSDLWGGNWLIPAYFALRDAGQNVHLASKVVPGQINVLMAYSERYLGSLDKLVATCVPVVACADTQNTPKLLEAGCHVIVQNALQATHDLMASRAHTLPMFPQQNLKRRLRSRRTTIERIVFMGDGHQVEPALRTDAFHAALRAMGVTFDIVDKSRIREWKDYSKADLVVAIRPKGTAVECKPPSKLINAWVAGVPALLGSEPAYQRLRLEDSDFIEVNSGEEVLSAVRRLKDNPLEYAAMLSRCDERAVEFSSKAIAQQWADMLFGIAAAGVQEDEFSIV